MYTTQYVAASLVAENKLLSHPMVVDNFVTSALQEDHLSMGTLNYIGSTFNNASTGFSGPSTMASLGYAYALSKRTSLYVDRSTTRWKTRDDNGRTSATGYVVGVTHSF